MRSLIVAAGCVLGAFAFGCGGTDAGPSLSITPSGTAGTVEITGPTAFSAVLVNSDADVTWTAAGGTLSSTAGLHVTFTPPLGMGTGMLTATAGKMTATVQITAKPSTITAKKIPGLTGPVTVQYDAQDIPHIKCAMTIDCIAVQGYIQARDRFFPMDFLRHVARSKLTELIGADGLAQDIQLRNIFVTRDGKRLEGELTKALDATNTALVQAFATGVNAYLGELTSAAQLPAEYAQLPFPLTPADIEPWTIQDTMALSRLQQFQLSETLNEELAFAQFLTFWEPKDSGKKNAWIRAAAPKTEQAHTLETTPFVPPAPLASVGPRSSPTQRAARKLAPWKDLLAATSASIATLHDQLRPADATVGSNNWVVGAAKSDSGFAMVANDPHLALQYPPLFHLAVLTSSNPSDNLDLAGGSFPGIPGALVGRGAHVGWGVTVVGYDVTDIYIEQFLPQGSCPGGNAGPPCVLFKGAPVSTIPVVQNFLIRNGAGPIAAHSTTTTKVGLVVPHHGPIIQAPDGAGKALSVRWTGHEGNTQDLKAFLGLNTAANVDAAITALKDFSTGAQNFVLADDAGHIAYDPHALVPVRKTFTEDLAQPLPPWLPLPGDGTAEWGDGMHNCAAVGATPVDAGCWIGNDVLPHGTDPAKGYFFTANADPIGHSDQNDPLGAQARPYLSFSWDDSTGFRATRIEQMLQAAIADHGKIKLEDMEAIQSDHVSRPGMVFTAIIDRIINAIPVNGRTAEMVAAKGILDQWAANGWDCPSGLLGTDPKTSPVDPTPAVVQNSSGCFLFHEFLRVLMTNVFTDDLTAAGQGVNGLQALKAMIYMLDPTTPPGDQTMCNDVDAAGAPVPGPAGTHTCSSQVVTALVTAFKILSAQVSPDPTKWVWGRVHTIKPVSLLQLVTNGFEPGPYARPGGAFTVDVGSPTMSGPGLDFVYGSGGNVRHISVMDPTKPTTKMQLPGPERDTPTGLPGPDLLGQWVKNLYFDYAIGSQIDSVTVSTQSFSAAQ